MKFLNFCNKKLIISIFCSFFSLAILLNAQTVNMLITQIDEIQESERDSVIIFENGVMDYLYEAGCIVSGEKINLDTDISKVRQVAIKASKAGYFEYLAEIEVNVDSKTDDILFVNYTLTDVVTLKVLGQGKVNVSKLNKEKVNNFQKLGNDVGKKIYSIIKKR
ncbi:MAG: hypothetical protein ACTTHG_00740 [Treponemataceae bacterium]